MITNERQYEQTKKAAAGFRDELAKVEAAPATKKRDVVVAGLRAQLRPLEAEVRAYEQLQASGGTDLESTLERLGVLLTQARIARKWRQQDLADKLGVTVGTVERYEKNEYETASLLTLCDAARVLGVKATVTAKMIAMDFAPIAQKKKTKAAP